MTRARGNARRQHVVPAGARLSEPALADRRTVWPVVERLLIARQVADAFGFLSPGWCSSRPVARTTRCRPTGSAPITVPSGSARRRSRSGSTAGKRTGPTLGAAAAGRRERAT